MFCTKCGTKLPDDVSFCPNCGSKLTPRAAGPAQPQAPVEQPVSETISQELPHVEQQATPAYSQPAMPQQPYTQPAASQQPAYAPPQPPYARPIQQPQPPQQPYYGQGYGAPAAPVPPAPPLKRKNTMSGGKRAVAVIAMLLMLAAGVMAFLETLRFDFTASPEVSGLKDAFRAFKIQDLDQDLFFIGTVAGFGAAALFLLIGALSGKRAFCVLGLLCGLVGLGFFGVYWFMLFRDTKPNWEKYWGSDYAALIKKSGATPSTTTMPTYFGWGLLGGGALGVIFSLIASVGGKKKA
jgi:hypothetical protein